MDYVVVLWGLEVVFSIEVLNRLLSRVTPEKEYDLRSSVFTVTSFQKRFFIAVPGFIALALMSCPRLRSSACRLRRSTLSPYCDAAGTGAAGGGPVAVMGRGVAALDVEVWRHWRSARWGRHGVVL